MNTFAISSHIAASATRATRATRAACIRRALATAALAIAALALPASANPTGGELVFAHKDPINSLDPAMAATPAAFCAISSIYEGLMRFVPSSVNVELGLAKRYHISGNGRIYTFWLRKNVRFSDGSPLRAQDVVFSLSRNPAVMALVKDMFTINDHMLQISLKAPFAPFLHYLAMPQSGIMSLRHAQSIGATEDNSTLLAHRPMGTGPFMLVNFSDRTELVANERYWRGSPHLAQVVMQLVPDVKERKQALKDGHAHIVELSEAMAPGKHYKFLSITGFNTLLLAFNTTNNALAHSAVRLAIMQSIDKMKINDAIYSSDEAEGVLPPSALGFDIAVKGPEYSPRDGKKLLNSAGFLHGFELNLVVFTDGPVKSVSATPAAEQIAKDLAEHEIKVNILPMSWADYQRGAQADLLLLNISSEFGDSDDFMHKLLRYNPTGYSSEQLKKLVRVARLSMNQREREQYYRAAQGLVAASRAWMVLAHERVQLGIQDGVGGFSISPLRGICDFSLTKLKR